jgi:hypothetical protein
VNIGARRVLGPRDELLTEESGADEAVARTTEVGDGSESKEGVDAHEVPTALVAGKAKKSSGIGK